MEDNQDDNSRGNKRLKFNESELIELGSSSEEEDQNGVQDNWRLNDIYLDNVDAAKNAFDAKDGGEKNDFIKDNVKVIEHPFKVVQMKHFLKEDTLINIKNSVRNLPFKSNNMDLYSYSRCSDQTKYENIHHFFRDTVRPFIEKVTGFHFRVRTSVNISLYGSGDYLLCHDDQVTSRKVAFILYLVEPSWDESCGGELELFECDPDKHYPTRVVHRLTPAWNTLTFFEVSPKSYHQVSEILNDHQLRISINGWFHVDYHEIIARNYELSPPGKYHSPLKVEDNNISYENILEWINPVYIDTKSQKQLRKNFSKTSEISLMDFILPAKLKQLNEALKSPEVKALWEEHYCPVWCKYDHLPRESLNTDHQHCKIVAQLFDLLNSEQFALILSELTSLKIHPNNNANVEEDDDVQCVYDDTQNIVVRGELRRWDKSYYTLLNDDDPETLEKKALDVILYFGDCLEGGNDEDEDEAVVIDASQPSTSSNRKRSTSEKSATQQVEDQNDKEVEHSNEKHDPPDVEDQSEKPAPMEVEDQKEKSVSPEVGDQKAKPGPQETDDGKKKCEEQPKANNHNDKSDKSPPSEIILSSSDEQEGAEEEASSYGSESSEDDETSEDENSQGGCLIYMDPKASSKPLLDIKPKHNSLNLVYRVNNRSSLVQRFMKYITHHNTTTPFYEFSFVYKL